VRDGFEVVVSGRGVGPDRAAPIRWRASP